MKPFGRRLLVLVTVAVALGVLLVVACEWRIAAAAKGRCFSEAGSVPETHAALVLGTSSRRANGMPNRFFGPRMTAAADLFKNGKVKALIVSGDNSRADYDEPTEMKEALVRLGVPPDRIVCDYAGFRTLDSVVRAKEVFGQTRIIIVSQRFHNERAIYLARASGIEAFGLNARDVPVAASPKTYVREKFACVKAVLDVNVLRTRPRFLGEPVSVP